MRFQQSRAVGLLTTRRKSDLGRRVGIGESESARVGRNKGRGGEGGFDDCCGSHRLHSNLRQWFSFRTDGRFADFEQTEANIGVNFGIAVKIEFSFGTCLRKTVQTILTSRSVASTADS